MSFTPSIPPLPPSPLTNQLPRQFVVLLYGKQTRVMQQQQQLHSEHKQQDGPQSSSCTKLEGAADLYESIPGQLCQRTAMHRKPGESRCAAVNVVPTSSTRPTSAGNQLETAGDG